MNKILHQARQSSCLLGHTRSHTRAVVQGGGGGVDGAPPPLPFFYVAIFKNDFAFSGKHLIFPTIMRSILWAGGAARGL